MGNIFGKKTQLVRRPARAATKIMFLHSFDKETGRVLWSFTPEGCMEETPLKWAHIIDTLGKKITSSTMTFIENEKFEIHPYRNVGGRRAKRKIEDEIEEIEGF
jgi:hypothetical protein